MSAFLTGHEGRVLIQFEGNMLFNEYQADTRLSFIRYKHSNESRLALVLRDRALDKNNTNDASRICSLFVGGYEGTVKNPKEGAAGAEWWFQEYDEQEAIARCKKIRPTIHAIWSAQRRDVGGRPTSRTNEILALDAALNGRERALQKERELQERLASSEGDRWCSSPQYLKNDLISKDQKLVALLVGKRLTFGKSEVAESAVLMGITVPNKRGPKSYGWTIYIVQRSGATYPIANGYEFNICEDCFTSK
jgi:hypothetical protein